MPLLTSLFERNKRTIQLFSVSLLICILAFIVLISNELTNTVDGMWKGTLYTGWGEYSWVIRIGRWFWPLIGKLRADLSPEPFTSILSLAIFTAGSVLIIDLFGLTGKKIAYVFVPSIVINTCVCADLSYRYMSPTFAVSFFCSVLFVWLLRRKHPAAWAASVISIVITLGSYQAYIGCSCLLVLMVLAAMLMTGQEARDCGMFFLRSLLAGLAACILYKLLWDLVLSFYDLQAANYNGASDLSISQILLSMPESIKRCYKAFYNYFFKTDIHHHLFQKKLLISAFLYVLPVIGTGARLLQAALRKPLRGALIALILLLLPVAVNSFMILAPASGTIYVQMSFPMELVYPCLCLLMLKDLPTRDHKLDSLAQYGSLALILVFLYGNFMAVSIDQHTMLMSRRNTQALMNRIMTTIEADHTLALSEKKLVFIGRPSDNPVYRRDETWKYSNGYARYGDLWLGGDCNTQSYYGLMRDCGFNYNFSWDYKYWHELENQKDVKDMPPYPAEGFYKTIDDVIVVKVSD